MSVEPAATIAAAMSEARLLGLDRLDAQLLIAHTIDKPRSWLLAHDEARLSPTTAATLREAMMRLAAGVPLAYIVGTQAFHGLTLSVTPDVLIPRPDTEVLVDWALELLEGELAPATRRKVVDLGTGSGAVALSIKQACPGADVTATDASVAALAVARHNAASLALDIEALQGSWWGPLEGRRFHLALSNPPYIAAGDPHLPALRHEPLQALTPGGDGLDAVRAIVAGAGAHLEAGGWLVVEHGFDQAAAVHALLNQHGFDTIGTRADLGGRPRCTGGRR